MPVVFDWGSGRASVIARTRLCRAFLGPSAPKGTVIVGTREGVL
jgi:hypothetical protein